MLHDIHFPDELTGEELDEYLSKGWYRMGQVIFTTNHILYEELLYRVYWLRYAIDDIVLSKSHRQLLKTGTRFEISLSRFVLTDETEQLYRLYRRHVAFEAPESVDHFLNDGGVGNIYDSYCFEIRDEGMLVGCGIFDKGKRSIAGIMNFYHPDYRKYSLGKLMILLKVEYARSIGMKWYYPGYIVPGNPRFDYKLFLGQEIASIWLPEKGAWVPYARTRR